MDKEQRNTKHMVMSVILMVYDICEKHNISPSPEGLSTAIYNWLRDGETPKDEMNEANCEHCQAIK